MSITINFKSKVLTGGGGYYYLDVDGRCISLTFRELQCLQLLVSGNTIKDVSVSIGISSRTVEFFVKSLRYKFSVDSKKKLIQLIHRRGLAPAINVLMTRAKQGVYSAK